LARAAAVASIRLNPAAALAFVVITLLHVVVGELAPKSVAISRTTETALRVALPMRVFYTATKPLVDVFNGLGSVLLRPFGIPPARDVGHAPHSEGELLELLAESREHGLIDKRALELRELLRALACVHERMFVTELLQRMRDERREMEPTAVIARP